MAADLPQDQVSSFSESPPTASDVNECVAAGAGSGGMDVGQIAALRIPKRFGGTGASNLRRVELLAWLAEERSPGIAAAAQAGLLGCAAVVYVGSEEQRTRWLPGWASGGLGPSLAVTEPGSGGNVLAMATTAHPEDGGWVISGAKCFVGNNSTAPAHVVIARTGDGPRGLSAFVVEADRPGVAVGAADTLAGLAGFSCGSLAFTGCRVPAENLVGRVGDGLDAAYAVSVLDGRLNIAAVAVGVTAAAQREAVAHATRRTIRGRRLCEMPTTLARLGRLRSLFLTARQVTAGAARLLDGGHACDEELVNTKHVAARCAVEAVQEAEEVFAAAGCTPDAAVHRLTADARPLLYAAGTPDIQLRRLGEAATGRFSPEQQWSVRFRERLQEICPHPSQAAPSESAPCHAGVEQ